MAMCVSIKYPYPPVGDHWKFRGGGGVSKPKKPSVGGGGGINIFGNNTISALSDQSNHYQERWLLMGHD